MVLNFLWSKLTGARLNCHLQLFGSFLQAIISKLFLEKTSSFVSIQCFIQITAEQRCRKRGGLRRLSWTGGWRQQPVVRDRQLGPVIAPFSLFLCALLRWFVF